ncbi:MAG: T9SS type A sorting domain-containing protein, partial [Flavobacteriales bacterium]|nr:T9SS type A sorting domain-containing protein [Flavobacteriales bacterium]
NSTLSAINENFVDGEWDNGFLDCPENEPEDILCELTLEDVSTQCQDNDSIYILSVTLSGSNGSFTLLSDNAISGNSQEFCFGQADDSLSSNSVTLELHFLQNNEYSFQVIQMDDDNCSQASVNQCGIAITIGPAPQCCDLEINCPNDSYPTFTCFDEIPEADISSIEIISSCAETSISVSESSSGSGCFNDPLFLLRTYTILSNGSEETCSQEFRLVDSISPVIECPPILIVDCSQNTTEPTEWATATDNCDDSPTITYSDIPFSGCNGFNRMWTATDNCGNMAVCFQEVLFQDTTAPILAIPNDIEIECTSSTDPSWTGMATAYDLCGEVDIDYTDLFEQGESCSGTITRIWTATDNCGNSSTGEQLISQFDLTGPVLYNVPPSTTIQCGEAPEPIDAIAIDACSGDSVEVTVEENIIPEGCRTVIQRIYSAIDSCDNATTLVRNIIIEDTQSPTITCPDDVTLTCGDMDYSPDDIGYPEAIDNCSGTSVTITYQDSELNMNTCPPEILRLWTAIDTCGNSSNCIQHIYFSDTTPPMVDCVENAVVNCANGETPDPVFTGTPVASDDCSAVTISYNDGPLQGECPLSFVRTWIIQDACFNAAFCQQVITIIDEVAPEIICSNIDISCAYSNADPSVTGTPLVHDCSSTTLVYEDGPLMGECPETFIRTWTVTDLCGNSTTCEQSISLVDNMIPVVFCPSDTSVSCNENLSPEFLGQGTAIDFCNSVSIDFLDSFTEGDCTSLLERTWIASDACGNTRSCVQSISILPVGVEMLECPNDTSIACDSSSDPILTGYPSYELECGDVEVYYIDSIVSSPTDTQNVECGQLRTQTQGGWGTSASGNNPGTYRDANFDQAFPNGVTLGCDKTLLFTSSQSVQLFLPSGSTATILNENYTDPSDYHNVLAGQVLALTLSVGFDEYDEDFGTSDVSLGDMVISNGQFGEWTVYEVLELANEVLGGCTDEYSAQDLNSIVSSINENYVDGNMDGGILECPGIVISSEICSLTYRTWYVLSACADTLTCQQIIYSTYQQNPVNLVNQAPELQAFPIPTSGNLTVVPPKGAEGGDLIEILNLSGEVIKTMSYDGAENSTQLELSSHEAASYIIRWTGANVISHCTIIKQ